MDRDSTEIGKYKIINQVGEGAMGVVYRALDPVLNRTVAIKVMSDAIARDDDLRGRFLREAQAAGSLQHPNVITIYDCGEVEGHLYIAMEFVEGEDLEEVLQRHVTLTLVNKIDIVIDVLGGLSYAHKRGIVHRDIKPANIRIDEEGRARIMDFGIAHLSSSNMTRTGVMVGTPAYMAPEQIVGAPITAATDLFSVGAVLYELLTGVKPFHADTLQSVMYKIVSQPSPDLPANSGVPPAMNEIVSKALAKDATQRYTSATEMANALTAFRAGLSRDARESKSISLRSVIDTALADQHAAKKKPPNRGMLIGGGVAGLVAILAAVLLANRGRSPVPTAANDAPAAGPAATQTASSSPPPGAQPAAPVPVPATPVVSAPEQKAAASPAPIKTNKSAAGNTAASAEELTLFRTLRVNALENRRRASDAGATDSQLQAGDEHLKAADGQAANNKLSAAADHLTAATTAWGSAERDVRAAAIAAAAAARGRTAVEAPKPVSAPASAPTPTQATASVQPPVAAPTPPPTSNPTADIRVAVAAYARAIESRDVNAVRRAYPDITADQASGFEQFFGTIRSLRANFSAGAIDVSSSTAEAKLTGEYDYVTNAGKSERQPVSFQATFRRDGGVWKLASVR
jgi:serine/threonine-protein kinase